MPRRNRPKGGKRQQRHIGFGQPVPRALRPTTGASVPVRRTLPEGRCKLSKKYIFSTEELASKALEEAQAFRRHQSNGHVEKRIYQCPEGPLSCGGWHLTSRESYEERGRS